MEQNVALRKAMRQLEARCVWGRFVSCLFIYLNIYCESESQYILYIMDHYGQSKIGILNANVCLFVD